MYNYNYKEITTGEKSSPTITQNLWVTVIINTHKNQTKVL